jgi:hypothetical protein
MADTTWTLDEANHRLLISFANGLLGLNYLTWQLTVIAGQWDQAFGRCCTYDPVRKLFVQVWKSSQPLIVYDFNLPFGGAPSPDPQYRRPFKPITGDVGFINSLSCKPVYHPRTEKVVIWRGGPDVWWVDHKPATMVSEKYTDPNGPAYLSGALGIYGKFNYVPEVDCFISQRWTTEKPLIYKPKF